MTDTFIAATTEPIENLGVIVNDWSPSTEDIGEEVVNQHPEELPLDLEKVIVWFSPEQYDALYRAAEFSNRSIELHVAQLAVDSLVTKVGTPKIFAPSHLSGKPTSYVSAPTYATDHFR